MHSHGPLRPLPSPSSASHGELRFAPGDSELEIAVSVLDDDIPEREEHFRVALKNPKGGAEIGFGGQVTVVIPTNDDAHGVVGFALVRCRAFFLGGGGYLFMVCKNIKVFKMCYGTYLNEVV